MSETATIVQSIAGSYEHFLTHGLIDVDLVSVSATRVRLASDGGDPTITARLDGTGFSQTGGGDPIFDAGVINTITILKNGDVAVVIDGLDIDATDFEAAINEPDAEEALAELFDDYDIRYTGSPGADDAYGYAGDDRLNGGAGNDFLDGDSGDDRISGGGGRDTLEGAEGDDTLLGGKGNDTLKGMQGDDRMVGGRGADRFIGGEGYDRVSFAEEGGAKRVVVNLAKGTGTDTFGGTDTYKGVEEIHGTAKNDRMIGNGADNFFIGGKGADHFDGRAGDFDQVSYIHETGKGRVIVDLAAGTATDTFGNTDTLANIEALRGTNRNDQLLGDSGKNFFRALGGDDTINGRAGFDEVRFDRDAHYGGGSGVTVDLRDGYAVDGFGDRDTLKGIEGIRGTAVRDVLRGSGGSNRIEGGGGNDVLVGRGGADQFRFRGDDLGRDVIKDFLADVDVILLQVGANEFADLSISGGANDAVVSFGDFEVVVRGDFDELAPEDFIFA